MQHDLFNRKCLKHTEAHFPYFTTHWLPAALQTVVVSARLHQANWKQSNMTLSKFSQALILLNILGHLLQKMLLRFTLKILI
jgi:hypothetical protein